MSNTARFFLVIIVLSVLTLVQGFALADMCPTVSVSPSTQSICDVPRALCWGYNYYGELGNGNTIGQNSVIQPSNLHGVAAVAGGGLHTVILKYDGSVWTCGDNIFGQLGNGNYNNQSLPVQVSGIANVSAIAAGYYHTLALRNDGTVWTWGYNSNGQLGNGSTSNRNYPVQATGLTNVIAVAGGAYHSAALKNDGTVWTWGYNSNGQLGNGNTTAQYTPVQVSGLTNVVAAALGYCHSVAVKADGTVWTWGYNSNGQLGIGNTIDQSVPVQVTGLTNVVAVAAGTYHTIALKSDGTVWAWGYNYDGQLGIGNMLDQYTPIQVSGLTNVIAISAGSDHAVALKSDGTVWAWGNGELGQIGNGDWIDEYTPTQVPGLSGVTSVAAGAYHTFALTGLGTATIAATATGDPAPTYQWYNFALKILGANASTYNTALMGNYTCVATNRCGNATSNSATLALNISPAFTIQPTDQTTCTPGSATLTASASGTPTISYQWYNSSGAISGATSTSYVAGTPDTYYCIAANGCGSSTSNNATLTAVVCTSPTVFVNPSSQNGCADGKIWDWGGNYYAELGNGSSTDQYSPIQVPGLHNIISVSGGYESSYALNGDGTVWAWGDNSSGQLGIGNQMRKYTPVLIPNLTGVTSIASGNNFALALKNDGTVWAWGYNGDGQLGNQSYNDQYTPVKVSGLSGVIAIAAGSSHSVALKGDGTVWAWGYGYDGQLGNGNSNESYTPVQAQITGIVAIECGSDHVLALDNTGQVWAWGDNYYGQVLGSGSSSQLSPIKVTGMNGMVGITGGYEHSLALKNDGTVWAWGNNNYGQLGTGNTSSVSGPIQVSTLSGVTAVSAGYYHSVALRYDGTVWSWGTNGNGQIGIGNISSQYRPVQASALSGVSAISAGQYHTMVLKDISKAVFTAVATGSPAPAYQWYKGSAPIAGATNSSYATWMSGSYKCVVSNVSGSASSNTVSMVENDPPAIIIQPVSASVCTAVPVFSIQANGAPSPSYQWYYEGPSSPVGAIDGATNSSYSPVRPGTYHCTATNLCGSVTSNSVVLIMGLAPQFTLQPVDQTVCTAGTATFTATATLSPSYQWYNSSGQISGATSSSYTTGVADTYYCIATNPCNYTESHHVTLNTIACNCPTVSVSPNSQGACATGAVLDWGNNAYGQLGIGNTTSQNTPTTIPGLSGLVSVAGGYSFSLALKYDGTVWGWGSNNDGELGSSYNTSQYNSPVQIAGVSDVVAIAAGDYHSLALRKDSTVWAWGENSYGQLGIGNTGYYTYTPTQVVGLTGVMQIAGGSYHSAALRSDGTIWAWGNNNVGQLGDGSATIRYTPVVVPGLSGMTAVAAGYNYTIALKNDGTVWTWGENSSGQLGNGTSIIQYTPVQVTVLTGIVAIAAGGYHALALKNDGTVWAWGENYYGQLGIGSRDNNPHSTPVQVSGLTNVIAIVGGDSHSMVIKNDGSVWGWGYNGYGQIGNGSTNYQTTPVKTNNLGNVFAIACGGNHSIALQNLTMATYTATVSGTPTPTCQWFNGSVPIPGATGTTYATGLAGNYTCVATNLCGSATSNPAAFVANIPPTFTVQPLTQAICNTATTTLTVGASGMPAPTYQWYNSSGVISGATDSGYTTGAADSYYCVATNTCGSATSNIAVITSVPCVCPTVTISPTSVTSCASGQFFGCGDNYDGQLGIGKYNQTSTPTLSPGYAGAVALAAGYYHSLAIKSDGTVCASGWNGYGQLGNGTTNSSNIPVYALGLTNIVSVASGGYHSLALKNDGTVWGWGSNSYGQLANGNTDDQNTPVQGYSFLTAMGISAGFQSTYVLNVNGTVWNCGYNNYGQLGVGETSTHRNPVQIQHFINVVAISAGEYHCLALKKDGTVWAWGYNYYGQLGNGNNTDQYSPVQVNGLTNVVAIAAGECFSLALKSDGTVWAWGCNSDGELGIGNTNWQNYPVQANISGVVSIACGYRNSLARKSDGSLWVWGDNYYGELGNGTTTDLNTPTKMSGVSNVVGMAGGEYFTLIATNPSPTTLTASATGSPCPAYQWFKDSQQIIGATNPSYSVGVGGSYTCVVTNPCGSVTSNTSTITLKTAPTITTQPSDKTTCSGFAIFSVTVIGDSAPSYQWYNSSGSIPGATSSSYSANASDKYFCVVSNDCGSATSNSATATINAAPMVTMVSTNQALCASGAAWDWGYNNYGQLGNENTTNQNAPVQVDDLTGVARIAGGNYHSIALKNDGTVWTWGYNGVGQLGTGDTTNQSLPFNVSGLTDMVGIAAGYFHSVALSGDGTVWTWGSNSYGQLGNGNNDNQYSPVQVSGLTHVVSVASGYYHTIALKNDGTVWTWGRNDHGQLGEGDTTNQNTPVQVQGLTGVIAIAGGYYHSAALKSDGTVWTWGWNNHGQLGTGDLIEQHSPVQAINTSGVKSIACGSNHTIALMNDGTVWTCGWNNHGQLGNGTTTEQHSFIQVAGVSNIVAVAGGYYHSIALKNDGKVWCWGWNTYGQLGNGNTSDQYGPAEVTTLTSVSGIGNGVNHTIAMKSSSSVIFAVSASGVPVPKYQWFNDLGPIAGATQGIYSADFAGNYYCVVSNKCGGATSGSVTLTFNNRPSFTTQPIDQTVNFPGTATFNVSVAGSVSPSIQWYDVNGPIPSATGTSYSTGLAGSYYCIATSDCGSQTSFTATLTLSNTPQPKSINDIKTASDDSWVETDAAIVSAAFPDYFYIESDNRTSGIRVEKQAHGLSAGMRADVRGQIKTATDSERYIAAILANQNGVGSVNPMTILSRQIGGSPITGLHAGITGGAGVNNTGLLVSAWGKFSIIDGQTFTLDDGSGVILKCLVPNFNVAMNGNWNYVIATGISSCETVGGEIHRLLLIRGQGDIIGY